MENKKVIVYVDALNLYYSRLKKTGREYVDLGKLFQEKIHNIHKKYPNKTPMELKQVKYFTACMKPHDKNDGVKRQKMYMKELQASMGDTLKIIEGYFRYTNGCEHCKRFRTEKATDVNLAINLIHDAHQNEFDIAFLVTDDGDFTGIPELIKDIGKEIFLINTRKPDDTLNLHKKMKDKFNNDNIDFITDEELRKSKLESPSGTDKYYNSNHPCV